ncbi:MAG: hypothetical protein IKM39_00685, partial [Clostridia bacterium]|nr:hypothetical protein [Clostridia bacterium]
WDGNVPATANVAGTICGLDGYLPVLAESPLHHTLVEMGVPVKQSLVGMFENGKRGQKIQGTTIDSTGSAKNDAYLWAMEKYFDRCSSHYLAYILDGAVVLKGYDAYEDHPTALLPDAAGHCLSNHDYLIARRCFFYDLDPYKYEAACDDPAQKEGLAPQGTDNATMIKIFERRFKRANGAFGQLLGFPPWWVKYTTHPDGNPQGTQKNFFIEWYYVEYITCYNLAKEADAAHPCSMTNGSFYYKYVPRYKEYETNKKADNITYDPNTYYYTLYIGDYDSSAWLKQHMYKMWVYRGGDRKLGQVKMMWSINPNLSERVPMVFDYLYENQSENDYFVGGDGGAGYIFPEALFSNKTLVNIQMKRPVENENAGDIFAAYSKKFYDRFDMEMTGFIINGGQYTFTKEMASCVSQYSPLLNFHHCYNTPVAKYNNTYFVYCDTEVLKTDTPNTRYMKMRGLFDSRMRGYKFAANRTICWTPTEINEYVTGFDEYMKGRGEKAQYCDPYTYLNMLKAANIAVPLN